MTRGVEVETRIGELRVFTQAEWSARYPRLVQGVTGRADDLDFGTDEETLVATPATPASGWALLQDSTGIRRVACCRQVHGADVVSYDDQHPAGVAVLGYGDAIVSARAGVLLTVTVADCVPVFLVDPERRLLGLAHAGWRGTAAGVVGSTLAAMRRLGAETAGLHAHLGPAICGKCYEVGPEVPAALGSPSGIRRVDLRAHIAQSVVAAGVDEARVTVSSRCTRCDAGSFFSYRGGDGGRRNCAFLGWRAS